jgi:hypothetical protein
MTSIPKFFPYVPHYSSWENFNGNLVMSYGAEPITISTEDKWYETANSLTQTPAFSSYLVPDPSLYSNWQDWASEFVLIVNGKVR